jgi:UDP-3-O-[3-hydroxymyristoyl] glucosamine N-acyltransferase
MRIDDYAGPLGLAVLRSREFRSLGYLNHARPEMLVPYHDARFHGALAGNGNIAMVIASAAVASGVPEHLGVAVAIDPMESFIKLHMRLVQENFYGAPFATDIAPDARIHPTAYVDPDRVRIGHGVVVGPNATVLAGTILEDEASVGPGTVIGSDGFEVRRVDGRAIVVPHAGGVRIGSGAAVQANVVVIRSLYGGATEIGAGTFIADLCRITHEVKIGENCRISGAVAVGGSTVIGDEVWIGPNATLSDGLRIGNRARVTLGAVVTQDVPDDGHVSGNFAIEHQKLIAFLRTIR